MQLQGVLRAFLLSCATRFELSPAWELPPPVPSAGFPAEIVLFVTLVLGSKFPALGVCLAILHFLGASAVLPGLD